MDILKLTLSVPCSESHKEWFGTEELNHDAGSINSACLRVKPLVPPPFE